MLIEVRNLLVEAHRQQLDAIKRTAIEHGVGMIVFDDPADCETWEEIVGAQRSETSPELLNDFIETQVSQAGQQTIASAIERSRGVELP
ncbi:hypothetical protein GIY30_23735 [Gordonia sp. HNM0687]|uniref:Uncharacterized protein n=1 Tax=Gordonia mangrovi TaxID=2665643 RepID=A0A6L7GXN6_9ACTN|nr:hypothetical protein [Gordonia mangrovi]MXP24337.1 hypothetical protein [Gordonia mangrovi]UVF80015.1 hypothetical protein NWF22_09410 [Gordonia mangrovi]